MLRCFHLTHSEDHSQLPLGARQQRFINEYLTDLNATRAAIAAGYSKRTASQAGWEVLRNPKVAAEISRRQKLLSERHEVTIENVISELAKIGFSNIAEFYAVGEAGHVELDRAALRDTRKTAAISQIEIAETQDGQVVKIKLFDKRAALGDLGRHLGLSSDRLDVVVQAGEPRERPSVRDLALASLALLSQASHDQEPEARRPLQIDGPVAASTAKAPAVEEERGPSVQLDSADTFDLDA